MVERLPQDAVYATRQLQELARRQGLAGELRAAGPGVHARLLDERLPGATQFTTIMSAAVSDGCASGPSCASAPAARGPLPSAS